MSTGKVLLLWLPSKVVRRSLAICRVIILWVLWLGIPLSVHWQVFCQGDGGNLRIKSLDRSLAEWFSVERINTQMAASVSLRLDVVHILSFIHSL